MKSAVLSVAYFAGNENVKSAIIQSDYIRRTTLNRLWALPGVTDMDRTSRNKLYDKIKHDVTSEGGMAASEWKD